MAESKRRSNSDYNPLPMIGGMSAGAVAGTAKGMFDMTTNGIGPGRASLRTLPFIIVGGIVAEVMKSTTAKADDGKKPTKGIDGINADYASWAYGTTPKAAAHIGALDSMIYQQNLRRAAAKGDPAAAAVADANTKPASTSAPPSREPSPDSTKAKIFSGITGMSAAATVASLVMRIPKLAAFNAMSTVMNGQIAGAYLNSSAKAKAQSAPERVKTSAAGGNGSASERGPASRSSYTTLDGRTVEATEKQSQAWGARRSK